MTPFRALVEAHLERWIAALPDDPLYAPMAYLLHLPAKRVRPALTLMGCELFGGRAEDALDEALGIELFHNFTLMHDDIMDASPLRRGQPTVHVRWDANAAILSGDALLVKAYQLMARRPEVLGIFGRYALQVCEGQQRDMDLEKRPAAQLSEYTEMIRLKTAVLLSCALEIGAAIAGAKLEERSAVAAFGEHLGLAFQLRDDLLDAFGDPGKVGKQLGGDLRSGKKTWLLINGLEREAADGRNSLLTELGKDASQRDVAAMLRTLEGLGVRADAEVEFRRHHHAALSALDGLAVPEERKKTLRSLTAALHDRAS